MATAVFVTIFAAVFSAIFVPFLVMTIAKPSKAEEEKARARRLAEARMNARLLRLNL